MRRPGLALLPLSAVLLIACGGQDAPSTPRASGPTANAVQAVSDAGPVTPAPAGEATPSTSETTTKASPVVEARKRARTVAAKRKVQAGPSPRPRRAAKAVAAARPGAAKAVSARPSGAAKAVAAPGPRRQKPLAPSMKRPCSLVAEAEARGIIGAPILAPIEAPQGPTCIYQSRSSGRFVTLTVQTSAFAKLEAQVRKRRNVTVARRRALCGDYGGPLLYLPLSRGRLLTVAGPCDMAIRFATKAVARL